MLRTTQLDAAMMIKVEPTTSSSRSFDLLGDDWINDFYSDDFHVPFVDLLNDPVLMGTSFDPLKGSPPLVDALGSDAADVFILQSLLCDDEPVGARPMASPVARGDFFRVHPHPPMVKFMPTKPATLLEPPTPQLAQLPKSPTLQAARVATALPPPQAIRPAAPSPFSRASVMLCGVAGCTQYAVERNRCGRHINNRKCVYPECTKNSQSNGLCIRHGGGRRCEIEGCPRGAQARGKCKTHGGGVRCKVPGCTRSSQGSGRCRTHGGGKLCDFPGCKKGTQRQGKCSAHGGARRCSVGGCGKVDRGGGLCAYHKVEALSEDE